MAEKKMMAKNESHTEAESNQHGNSSSR